MRLRGHLPADGERRQTQRACTAHSRTHKLDVWKLGRLAIEYGSTNDFQRWSLRVLSLAIMIAARKAAALLC